MNSLLQETPFEYPTELCEKAYQKGVDHARVNSKKLPQFVNIDGVDYPVIRSSGFVAREFTRGWKSVKK